MIVTRLIGGLGNQLFQYAMARAVADYHCVELKLDVSAYNRGIVHRGYRLFNLRIRGDIATDGDIKSLKGSNDLIGEALRKTRTFAKKTFYKERKRLVFDKRVFASPERYFQGYWQNENYFLGIRETIVSDFQPKCSLSKNALEHEERITSSDAVSLHIRRGDYLKHPEIGVLELEYYKRAVDYIKGSIRTPKFFVFSDDIVWCQENLSFVDDVIYVNNTVTEIDDLVLMSTCNHNIIANSSFSWWGAWLNRNREKIVVAPHNWAAKKLDREKRVPESWIEL